ncbi:putative plastid-lipid-associated protein 10 chloroplastic [Zea mays]|uniref:Putative plastid-lipid-associated protein 10 chloroplastic n=1 Tax=Zea mays TaxID=4577 RepID=A0A1D6EK86_MAIZE|nr:putative plastid-lipid-associated protein 10 chloroplastic [Zea mays]
MPNRPLSNNSHSRNATVFVTLCLVAVEERGAGKGTTIDLAALDGTWRLCYTSASDVLVLFEAAERLPLLQVGQIYQKFECKDRSDGGIVRNVVRWSIENLLEEQEGATLMVSAKFVVLSK